MSSKEQLELAEYVKSVHETLWYTARLLGPKKAWEQHCQNEEILQKYALSMQNLAQNFWETNSKLNDKVISRVSWIYNFCQHYFFHHEINRQLQKELDIATKINLEIIYENKDISKKLKILDVGSCYNPFQKYEIFDVTAIDIAPATKEVYKCDFLNLSINASHNTFTEDKEITSLQSNFWQIVVFSLFLEYLPSPDQREICCQLAYNLLQNQGILFIITPDSKHVHANSKIMKSWRLILANMGFSRIKYEKLPHLHCMVFRKCIKKEIAVRWAQLHHSSELYQKMFIPQDFYRNDKNCDNGNNDMEKNEACDASLFEELPYV